MLNVPPIDKSAGGDGGFFLACEDLGEGLMIHSPPALFF